MIKFFRKIRQNSLMKNKTGKYFKYAIGEIVLVVIGILIALQINNWNENRKSNVTKQDYYNQLIQDLTKDNDYIKRNLVLIDSNIVLFNNYIKEFQNQDINPKLVLYNQTKLNNEFTYLSFNTNTIETLQYTGDIKLIPVEIRNKLIDLKRSQNILIKTTSSNDGVFLKEFVNVVNLGYAPNFDFLTKENKIATDLNIEENIQQMVLQLNGAYSLKNFTEKLQSRSLKSMLITIDDLTKQIKTELEK